MISKLFGRVLLCFTVFLVVWGQVRSQNSSPVDVKCFSPGPISNGRVRTTVGNGIPSEMEFPVGTELQYSCDLGYVLEGDQHLYCLPTGFWSEEPPFCKEDCGFSMIVPSPKIANGNKTSAGEWPWMVSIYEGRYGHICGGALLDRRTILTAAHCLMKDSPNYKLHFGKEFRRLSHGEVIRNISRIIIHPQFNQRSFPNDIALVKLESNLMYTDKILPICLPNSRSSAVNLVPGSMGIITGFGMNEMHLRSQTLQMAMMPVQSNDTCQKSLKEYDVPMEPDVFCAGYPKGGTSPCKGDGGSPFVFYDRRTNRYTLEGCFSHSLSGQCDAPGRYSFLTKVFSYIDWIKENMRDDA